MLGSASKAAPPSPAPTLALPNVDKVHSLKVAGGAAGVDTPYAIVRSGELILRLLVVCRQFVAAVAAILLRSLHEQGTMRVASPFMLAWD